MFSKLRAPRAREELISGDLEADEGFRLGRGDGNDLAGVTRCRTRCSCDDGASLGSPAGEIRGQFSHDTDGGILSDIEGVGESTP